MEVCAQGLCHKTLNDKLCAGSENILITDCCGQRYIACASKGKNITIKGTPGNALGAYLDGSHIEVFGNAQDAVGDAMNEGTITVHGDAGDALGYAMRGGIILIKGNAGYRTGIHMKQYSPEGGPEKKPQIFIGGRVGSFLGEYMAGGLLVVLGLGCEEIPIGDFTGTGMHGGRIFIRSSEPLRGLPPQVTVESAREEDLQEILPQLAEFCTRFNEDFDSLSHDHYWVLSPCADNPYKQLYC